MLNLIPKLVHDNYKENNLCDTFESATLFMDISGFTPMTERLMNLGNLGIEVLSNVLNNVFDPVIEVIYKHNGFVSGFAGDALTAIFKDTTPEQCLYTAYEIRELFKKEIGLQKTQAGEFQLYVKLGLSYGEIVCGIVGNEDKKTHYFSGKAIDGCADSEHHCERMNIVLDEAFLNNLSIQDIETNKIDEGYYELVELNINEKPQETKITKLILEKDILSKFFPQKILDLSISGELRDIASVFISFNEKKIKGYDKINDFASKLLSEANLYDGYCKGIDYGDKGGTALVVFGAPTSYEDTAIRACLFILSLKQKFRRKIRAGISFGSVYAGLIGNHLRFGYDVLGDTVNLSARLMSEVKFGKIWISERAVFELRGKFTTDLLGRMILKGKATQEKVYELLSKKEIPQEKLFRGKIVGRENEIYKINVLLKPLYKGKFGDVLYLYGDAGIGKSRLIFEISKEIEKDITTYTLECEGILKKSLNPFIFLLNIYFEQANVRDNKEKEDNFDDIFEELINNIESTNREDKDEIIEKLEKSEVFIKHLMGFEADSDLYEELEPEERFNNTIFAIKELIKAISVIKPLIIHIDDIHQIDDDSKKLIEVLIRNVDDYPFLIIGSGRFNDDGTKPSLITDEKIRSHEIILEGLKEKDKVNIMIKNNMGYKADDKLLSFLISRTSSNPFYLEQFCLHLHEAKQIKLKNDRYTLVEKTERIPKSINSLLTARIDRLPNALKEIVLIASVLGKEFNVKILSEVLNNLNELLDRELITRQDFDFKTISTITMNNSINELLKTGSNESLWDELSKLKYLFKYNLLVESAYNMQLKDRLHKLHKVAAESIEEIFSGEAIHYWEIAYHYVKAEINYKAILYLEKAGDYAKEIYDNQIALNSYKQLIKLLPENNYEQKLKINYKLCQILEITGKWNEAIEILQSIVSNSDNVNDKKLFAEINLLYGKILAQKGDFKKSFDVLQKTKKLSEEIKEDKIFGSVLKNIGILYSNQSDFDKALDYFEQALDIFTKINEEVERSNSLNAIGIIYAKTGKIEEALKYFQQSLSSSELINNKQGISNSLSNIGRIYEIKEDLDKALECQKKSLAIREEIGYKKGISICLGSISEIYRLKKEYEKALKYQFDALSVFEEIGDEISKALSLNIIGLIYKNNNNFNEALEYFTKALEIFYKIKDKKNIAFVLGNVGLIYYELGEYKKALDYQFSSLEIKKTMGQDKSISNCLFSISEVFYMEKNYKNALEYLKEAIKTEELKEFDNNINSEYTISFINFYIKLNDINKALKHILFFFQNYKKNHKDINYWSVYLSLAKILGYHKLNDEQNEILDNITKFTELEKETEIYFKEVIEKTEKNNYFIVLISALLEYGKYLYLKKDDPEKALSLINKSKDIANKNRLKGRLREIRNVIDEIINKKSNLGGPIYV